MWGDQPVDTISVAFRRICEGQQPWVALGDFLNYWFAYAKDRRSDLVAEPLSAFPEGEYYLRWAAFCAASVEHLCHKYNVSCPAWVDDPKYVLPEPWYYHSQEDQREWLVSTTPEEFKKRNIYSGSSESMFANKWELVEQCREKIEQFKRLSKKERRVYWKTGKMPARN